MPRKISTKVLKQVVPFQPIYFLTILQEASKNTEPQPTVIYWIRKLILNSGQISPKIKSVCRQRHLKKRDL